MPLVAALPRCVLLRLKSGKSVELPFCKSCLSRHSFRAAADSSCPKNLCRSEHGEYRRSDSQWQRHQCSFTDTPLQCSKSRNPHLTLALSPPTGLHRGHHGERRGKSIRTPTVFAPPATVVRWKEISTKRDWKETVIV